MDYPGAAFSISPVISTSTKIIANLHDTARRFKRAPSMMTSIVTECNLINGVFQQLQNFDWPTLQVQAESRMEQMKRSAETLILGCTLTLSVVDEYSTELQEYVEGFKLSPTEQMGLMARVRVIWKEDETRELLLQLRGYHTGLTNLLRAAHEYVDIRNSACADWPVMMTSLRLPPLSQLCYTDRGRLEVASPSQCPPPCSSLSHTPISVDPQASPYPQSDKDT
jgi:hypothetical protein